MFSVEIIDNPAAAKCNLHGDYEFHVCTENFAIVDSKLNKRLYTWPFRHIRRYGKSSTNFQFEAGRKSQSGEGGIAFLGFITIMIHIYAHLMPVYPITKMKLIAELTTNCLNVVG